MLTLLPKSDKFLQKFHVPHTNCKGIMTSFTLQYCECGKRMAVKTSGKNFFRDCITFTCIGCDYDDIHFLHDKGGINATQKREEQGDYFKQY